MVRSAAIGAAIAVIEELYDLVREKYWPTEQHLANKQRYEAACAKLQALENEELQKYRVIIQQIDQQIKAIEHAGLKQRVKRAFYKSLVDYENDVCDEDGIPRPCKDIAKQFKELWGIEEYGKEVAAFRRLRGKNNKIIVSEN